MPFSSPSVHSMLQEEDSIEEERQTKHRLCHSLVGDRNLGWHPACSIVHQSPQQSKLMDVVTTVGPNWLPTQILYTLVFPEMYVQCGKLIPVSPVKYFNLLTIDPAVKLRKPLAAVAGQTPLLLWFGTSWDFLVKRKLIWSKLKTCLSQWCEKISTEVLSKFHQNISIVDLLQWQNQFLHCVWWNLFLSLGKMMWLKDKVIGNSSGSRKLQLMPESQEKTLLSCQTLCCVYSLNFVLL